MVKGKTSSRGGKHASAGPAPKHAQSQEEAIRRRRNRLSQRSFRERRHAYISELEETSRRASQSESDRNKALNNENVELRNAYLKLRTKLFGVICTLQEIGEEAGKRLNLTPSLTTAGSEDADSHLNGADLLGDERDGDGIMLPSTDIPPTDEPASCGRTPSTRSSSYPVELSDAPEQESLGNSFKESNAQESSNGTTMAQTAPPNLAFHESSEIFTDPVVASAVDLMDMSHAIMDAQDSYQEQHHDQDHTAADSEARLGASVYSNGNFGDIADGNGLLTRMTPGHQSQLKTAPTWQTTASLYSANSAPYNWWHTPAPQSIPLASQLVESFQQQRPYGSLFLEHMDILEALIRQRIEQLEGSGSADMTSGVVSTAVILFHDYAWQGTARFWGSSQARSILESVLAWRCMPNSVTLANLPLAWRPTPLQLYIPHSCVIDWFPHPGLRDALILHYNNSPILDQLFWDCMDCWVVTVEDIATILTDVDHGPGLIGVWNIVEAMDGSRSFRPPDVTTTSPLYSWQQGAFPASTQPSARMAHVNSTTPSGSENSDDRSHDPADSNMRKPLSREGIEWVPMPLDVILSRKDLARDLFYHLNMHDTISNWLFDPHLFESYPELKYPGYETLVAKGRSFRRPAQKIGPTKMSSWTINLYQKALLGRTGQLKI
ncbi:DNA damage response protein [Fonsecaea nubica]|uniref:DNA damage response protein n=1 Tax=Fonsecaea nubica TaxID=856822 RepID=A0A178DFQ5_9EURO|nr:DNA damage response protein [Fonsecaea nubica]OAL40507.1 DNA damage response protein [Fonsecaea nubica]